MKLNIHGRGVAVGPTVRDRVERRLGYALGRFGLWVERVGVRLYDVNGPRGGVDKRCRIVVAVRGHGPVVVEDNDADLTAVIDRAADRVGQAVGRRLERVRTLSGFVDAKGIAATE